MNFMYLFMLINKHVILSMCLSEKKLKANVINYVLN